MSTGLNSAEGSEHRMFVRQSVKVSRKKVAGMNATASELGSRQTLCARLDRRTGLVDEMCG